VAAPKGSFYFEKGGKKMREKEGETPKEADNRSDFEKFRALLEGRDERAIEGKGLSCTLGLDPIFGRQRVSVDIKTDEEASGGYDRQFYQVASFGLERVDFWGDVELVIGKKLRVHNWIAWGSLDVRGQKAFSKKSVVLLDFVQKLIEEEKERQIANSG